ncbi:MAG: glycosyltransferase family 2 protein [Thermodesulfovibrionales bacterium]|nr:glycosyltransferase family 2 protein [Thermodesulfovibrionales bacterium]
MESYDCNRIEVSKLPISVIILTHNEEKNIRYALESIKDLSSEIFIVDSFSEDNTLDICRKYTDKVYQHPFETQAKQFNWALDNLPVTPGWIMRLDADEMVTPELANELSYVLPNISPDITGLYVKRRVYFMGRWIKHGGYYPIWLLRIFQKEKGQCEERFMDEHVVVTGGRTIRLKHDIIDYNRKGLSFWIDKHNQFATREMIDLLALGSHQNVSNLAIKASLKGFQGSQKRWLKENVYVHLPLFFRSFLYFLYRYFFRLGFLDGKEGLIFHFLQGFWFRFLVDAKIFEMKRNSKSVVKSKNQIPPFRSMS